MGKNDDKMISFGRATAAASHFRGNYKVAFIKKRKTITEQIICFVNNKTKER